MNLNWIDEYVEGLIEYCNSRNVYDIYETLNISIKRIDMNNPLLQGNEAMYIRSYLDVEMVFIREDLPDRYEKFVLAHELGHAILHTEIAAAAYNNRLLNKGKLEKQADYFALRLLNISIDKDYFEGYSLEQIAKALYVTEDSLKLS